MAENSFCPKCGSPVEPNTKFCERCGAPLAAATPAEPVMPVAPVEKTPVAPVQEIPVTPVQEIPVTPVQEAPTTEQKPKKKMTKKKVIILSVVAVALVAIIAIAAVLIIKFSSSPIQKIAKGYTNLVNSDKTYNTQVDYSEHITFYDGDTYDGSINVSANIRFNLKNGYLALDNIKSNDLEISGAKAYVDANNKQMGAYIDMDGLEAYVCNDYVTVVEADYSESYLILKQADYDLMMSVISDAFAVAGGEKIDEEEFDKNVIALISSITGEDVSGADIDLSGFSSNSLDNIEKNAVKYFTNTKWLKENFDFTKEKVNNETVYSFKITSKSVVALKEVFAEDIVGLLTDVYSYVKPNDSLDKLAKEYRFDLNDINPNKIENLVMEMFRDAEEGMIEDNMSILLNFGLTKDVLTSVLVELRDYEYVMTFTVRFDELSNGIEFTSHDFDKYYDSAKKELDANPITIIDVIEKQEKAYNCISNMRVIKSNAANFYATYNRVPTIDDIAFLMDDGKIPVCPFGKDYIIVVDEYGSAEVYCQSEDCENYEEYVEPSYEDEEFLDEDGELWGDEWDGEEFVW